jgi:Na+/H+-dicarboxylate symporter
MKIWVKVLIGLVLGVLFGLFVGEQFKFLSVMGKVFIDLLKMLVGLIVFSSIVTGICHINDPKKLGRIGIRTLIFYAVTTLIAITIGVVIAYIVHPGSGLSLIYDKESIQTGTLGLLDFVASLIPSNPFASFAEGNIMQIIVFSILFAYAIILTGEKGKMVFSLIESLSDVMHHLTHFVMKFAPYGVFALIAVSVGSMGIKVVLPLMKFLACNYIACLIQICVVFSLILRFLAKVPVLPFFKGMKDAIVLAFSTSSSAATLPVSMECAREQLGVSEDISGFVLSLGSTINMNGAAIGLATASIFIAEVYGIELSALQIGIIVFTSFLSAVGAAGIPGAGVVMLSIVLNAVGLPLEGIAIVAGVDRIRDMISTVANILGDGVAAVYVAKKENRLDERLYNHATWLK